MDSMRQRGIIVWIWPQIGCGVLCLGHLGWHGRGTVGRVLCGIWE